MKNILAQNTNGATENTNNFMISSGMERGVVVLAKVASGKWVKRRVWSVEGDIVYLCSEQLYTDLLIGASRLWPIGFPKIDVRLLEEEVAA